MASLASGDQVLDTATGAMALLQLMSASGEVIAALS